jgi:hypothetical protein
VVTIFYCIYWNVYWNIILNKYLYIVDYWVDFPSSEYGGVSIVVAKNEDDAASILENHEILKYGSDYWKISKFKENVLKKVKQAQVFLVDPSTPLGVKYEFHT